MAALSVCFAVCEDIQNAIDVLHGIEGAMYRVDQREETMLRFCDRVVLADTLLGF